MLQIFNISKNQLDLINYAHIWLSLFLQKRLFTGPLKSIFPIIGVKMTKSNVNSSQLLQRLRLTRHKGQNLKKINIPKYILNFLICGAKMSDKCVKSQRKIFYIVLFCKVKLSKMASIKTNKIQKQTVFFNPIFHDIQLCLWSY